MHCYNDSFSALQLDVKGKLRLAPRSRLLVAIINRFTHLSSAASQLASESHRRNVFMLLFNSLINLVFLMNGPSPFTWHHTTWSISSNQNRTILASVMTHFPLKTETVHHHQHSDGITKEVILWENGKFWSYWIIAKRKDRLPGVAGSVSLSVVVSCQHYQ